MTYDLGNHVTIQTQITRYNGMRILHNYRNISRATKQFLNGDRLLEQLMILTLRDEFYAPMTYKAPIEQSFMIVSSISLSLKLVFRDALLLTKPIDTTVYSLTTSTQSSSSATPLTTDSLLTSTTQPP